MSNTKNVTVGNLAYSFHDASTGITVSKGEVVALRSAQLNSPRIKQALNTGHLIYVHDDTTVQINTKEDIDKLSKRIKSQHKKGMTIEKIATGITLDQAKALANENEVTVEDTDTVVDILKAILEEE